MKGTARTALAVGMAGGYVLGRMKKARLALGVASRLGPRRHGSGPHLRLTAPHGAGKGRRKGVGVPKADTRLRRAHMRSLVRRATRAESLKMRRAR